MPNLLQNPAHMSGTAHASNGARLVSPTGERCPLQRIQLTCEAFGGIARTRLNQHFSNPHPIPLQLTYAFALPADGAVSGYTIRAGDRTITGKVEPRARALEEFEAACLEGRTAGLVEQERSSLFTQQLGNIPAQTDVVVELTIDHPLKWVSGYGWEWRFPTVVAPRYLGAAGVVADAGRVTTDVAAGTALPTASVTLTIAEELSTAPMSPTHEIVVTNHAVTLAAHALLDRDLVIRWAIPRLQPGCSVRAMQSVVAVDERRDAYGLLTIVPPTVPVRHFPRDLVLLLDVSGSMSGQPLDRLKAVMTSVIDSLTDADYLDMIAFASFNLRFQEKAIRATPAWRARARAWVQALQAGGGTEMISAINEALRPLRDDTSRQVIVATDGLIGFEAAAIRAIRDGLPRASRLHTVGVGSAANQAFLKPAARAGRGVDVLIDLDEAAANGADRIVAATREPVAIDVVVEGTAVQAAPRLPDLLSGSPVVAAVRLRPAGGSVIVRGVTPEGSWEQRLDVPTPTTDERLNAIPALWAREAIEALELELACGGDGHDIDPQIERLGVEYSISSRLTSWVAIAEQPSVDPREPVRAERIPQSLPYGLDAEGFGLNGGFTASLSLNAPALLQRIPSRPGASMPAMRGRMVGAGNPFGVVRRLKNLGNRALEAMTGSGRRRVAMSGRIIPHPSRSTVTIEIAASCDFNWEPPNVVMLAGDPVEVLETGTTRTGPIATGSLVRIELTSTLEEAALAREIELQMPGMILLVMLEPMA